MAEPTIAHWIKYGKYEAFKFWTHPLLNHSAMSFTSFPYDTHSCSLRMFDLSGRNPRDRMVVTTQHVGLESWARQFSPTLQEYSYKVMDSPPPMPASQVDKLDKVDQLGVGGDLFSVVGFRLTMERKSGKYIQLYYFPTGRKIF